MARKVLSREDDGMTQHPTENNLKTTRKCCPGFPDTGFRDAHRGKTEEGPRCCYVIDASMVQDPIAMRNGHGVWRAPRASTPTEDSCGVKNILHVAGGHRSGAGSRDRMKLFAYLFIGVPVCPYILHRIWVRGSRRAPKPKHSEREP
jgi:hypothetical protein